MLQCLWGDRMTQGEVHYRWMAELAASGQSEDNWWLALGAAARMADYLEVGDREALKEALLRASTGHMEWLPLASVKELPDAVLWNIPRDPCWGCCWIALLKANYESSKETPDDVLVRAMVKEAWRTCPSTILADVLCDAVKTEASSQLDDLLARTSTVMIADTGLDAERGSIT